MSEKYTKNSLLGQLEQKGILNNNSNQEQYMPFGILTGHGEFFLSQNDDKNEVKKDEIKIMKKRLNDLDNNIFQEGSYLDIKDNELDNNEKAAKIQRMIEKIDKKIFMLEDCDDEILKNKLKEEKQALENTLGLLTREDFIQNAAQSNDFKKCFLNIENYIFKIFPILKKIFLVRHALNKLVMLNESAKELLAKKIPYGEQEGRYNDFITYLSCANVIHSKLTKKM